MSTYVIGDVQGCFDTLMSLMQEISFDRDNDRLWFVGDLVNRGPKNVEVLRWVRDLGDRATVVLGNHDLHLIARSIGASKAKSLDTLDDVLGAPDCESLIDWLRHQPVVATEGTDILVHAGLWPEWTLEQTLVRANDVADGLTGSEWRGVVRMLASTKVQRVKRSNSIADLTVSMTVFQRVRMIDISRAALVKYSGPPEDGPKGAQAWFDVDSAREVGQRVFFGHWSALGLQVRDDVVGLDTGCVWGRKLTAYDRCRDKVISVASLEGGQTS